MIVCVKRSSGTSSQTVEGKTLEDLVENIKQKFVCASISTIFQLCISHENGMTVVVQVKNNKIQDLAWKLVSPFCELVLLVQDEIIPVHSFFSQKLRKCKSSAAVLDSPICLQVKKKKAHHDHILMSAKGLVREYPWHDPKLERAWKLSSEKSFL